MEHKSGTVMHPFLYDASDTQLQEFLLLGLFVAGKNAITQQHKLNWFLETLNSAVLPQDELTPLARLATLSESDIERYLRFVGAGQYGRLTAALSRISRDYSAGDFCPRTCSREDLVTYPGMGYKTASFFLIYTRSDVRHACLDTHILRWLRVQRGYSDAPAATPTTRKKYLYWEDKYLGEAEALNKNPTTLDFDLWLEGSKNASK
jgi:hypothetical protein